MEFENLTDLELSELATKIEKERTVRRQHRKAQLWEEVRKAIANFEADFGSIAIYDDCGDTVYLNANCDFSTHGEISVR